MTVEWIERVRQRSLDRVLNSPDWSDAQRRTAHKLNQTWLLDGRRTVTRDAKLRTLLQFGRSINKPFEDATKDDIRAFLAEVASRTGRASLETFKQRIKSTYKTLLRPNRPGHPPIVAWIRLTSPHKLARQLQPEDLVSHADLGAIANATEHPRDRAFVMLLYDSGCRISEIIGARVRDLEFDHNGAVLNVNDGKTGPRRVRLVYSIIDLRNWLASHPYKSNPDAPLFVRLRSRTCVALQYRSFHEILATACNRAGIKKRVFHHLMRHSNASEWGPKLGEFLTSKRYGFGAQTARVYVHPSEQQMDDILLTRSGLKPKLAEEEASPPSFRECMRCKTRNSPTSDRCSTCASAIDPLKFAQEGATLDAIKEELPALLALLKDKEVQALLKKRRWAPPDPKDGAAT